MVKKTVTVKNATGFSLKPTEKLYKCALQFKAHTTFEYPGGTANCKSILSILGSGVKCGDEILIVCSGNDEQEALDALTAEIEAGLGE